MSDTDKTSVIKKSNESTDIPLSADNSLSSTMSKGFNSQSSIPTKPDRALFSAKTMSEETFKKSK